MIYLYAKQANWVLPSVIEGRVRKNLHATPISTSNQIQNKINLINLDLPMPWIMIGGDIKPKFIKTFHGYGAMKKEEKDKKKQCV